MDVDKQNEGEITSSFIIENRWSRSVFVNVRRVCFLKTDDKFTRASFVTVPM